MKMFIILCFIVVVNGLPKPQELLDRPDPNYGKSGDNDYGGYGNDIKAQVLQDVVGGFVYDEDIFQQKDDYTTKDTGEKLKNNVSTDYKEDEDKNLNDDYSGDGNDVQAQVLKDASGEYDEEISQKNDGYTTEDSSKILVNNVPTDYKEPQDQNLEDDYIGGKNDIQGQVLKDVVGGYDEEISQKNDGYTTKDSSEKLKNNVPTDYTEPEDQYLEDTATIEKDSTLASCASFTEDFGYMCVPYYQCRNGTIITDGAGLIDVRNGFGALDAQDGKCPGFLDVCCKDPDFVAPPPKPQPYQASCGRRNQDGLGARILGFKEGESQVGEWPHMCALLREETVAEETPQGYVGGEVKSSTVNHFVCGASLIAPGAVLTGAHCVNAFNKNDILKVRCGEWDTQTEDEPYQHQDRYVNNFEVHPGFKSASLYNDVAVLFTSADFVMDHNIDTICLPEPGEAFVNENCFATGWGKDKFGKEGQYQVILKEIDLPVTNFQQCEASLQQTRLGSKFDLHHSFLCAGGKAGKDTCQGDGGSPLVCPSKNVPNRYVQAGIVAWGIGCGDATPGVYADVSQAACFIDHTMACNGATAGSNASSHWGYTKEQCGNWIQNQIDDAISEIPSGTPKRIVPAIKQSIQTTWTNWIKGSCAVNYVDIGGEFARQEEQSYNGNNVNDGIYVEHHQQDQTGNTSPYRK